MWNSLIVNEQSLFSTSLSILFCLFVCFILGIYYFFTPLLWWSLLLSRVFFSCVSRVTLPLGAPGLTPWSLLLRCICLCGCRLQGPPLPQPSSSRAGLSVVPGQVESSGPGTKPGPYFVRQALIHCATRVVQNILSAVKKTCLSTEDPVSCFPSMRWGCITRILHTSWLPGWDSPGTHTLTLSHNYVEFSTY